MVTNNEMKEQKQNNEAEKAEELQKGATPPKKLDEETIQILLDDRISTGG